MLAEDLGMNCVGKGIASFGLGAQIFPEIAHPLLTFRWELGVRFTLDGRLGVALDDRLGVALDGCLGVALNGRLGGRHV